MDCDNTAKLREMLVGIEVMFHMSVHVFQDALLIVDDHLSRCECKDCQNLESRIRQAKKLYEQATLGYIAGSDFCEMILDHLNRRG